MSPTIRNKTHYFHKSVYQNSTLYIPNGTISDFETADVWKNFQNIQMYDPDDPSLCITNTISNKPITIVNGKNILIKKTEASDIVVYTLDGRVIYKGQSDCIEMPAAGIYIVRVGNNATKVLVK